MEIKQSYKITGHLLVGENISEKAQEEFFLTLEEIMIRMDYKK
jgi:hypothetical protein